MKRELGLDDWSKDSLVLENHPSDKENTCHCRLSSGLECYVVGLDDGEVLPRALQVVGGPVNINNQKYISNNHVSCRQ